jgi:hypothetical protein
VQSLKSGSKGFATTLKICKAVLADFEGNASVFNDLKENSAEPVFDAIQRIKRVCVCLIAVIDCDSEASGSSAAEDVKAILVAKPAHAMGLEATIKTVVSASPDWSSRVDNYLKTASSSMTLAPKVASLLQTFESNAGEALKLTIAELDSFRGGMRPGSSALKSLEKKCAEEIRMQIIVLMSEGTRSLSASTDDLNFLSAACSKFSQTNSLKAQFEAWRIETKDLSSLSDVAKSCELMMAAAHTDIEQFEQFGIQLDKIKTLTLPVELMAKIEQCVNRAVKQMIADQAEGRPDDSILRSCKIITMAAAASCHPNGILLRKQIDAVRTGVAMVKEADLYNSFGLTFDARQAADNKRQRLDSLLALEEKFLSLREAVETSAVDRVDDSDDMDISRHYLRVLKNSQTSADLKNWLGWYQTALTRKIEALTLSIGTNGKWASQFDGQSLSFEDVVTHAKKTLMCMKGKKVTEETQALQKAGQIILRHGDSGGGASAPRLLQRITTEKPGFHH